MTLPDAPDAIMAGAIGSSNVGSYGAPRLVKSRFIEKNSSSRPPAAAAAARALAASSLSPATARSSSTTRCPASRAPFSFIAMPWPCFFTRPLCLFAIRSIHRATLSLALTTMVSGVSAVRSTALSLVLLLAAPPPPPLLLLLLLLLLLAVLLLAVLLLAVLLLLLLLLAPPLLQGPQPSLSTYQSAASESLHARLA
jgi:hypothetical protein